MDEAHNIAHHAAETAPVDCTAILDMVTDYRYRAELAADGIMRLVAIHGSFSLLSGYSTGDITSRDTGFLDLIHPDDREYYRQSTGEVARGAAVAATYRLLTRTGNVLWVRDYMRAAGESAPGVVYGGVQDITRFKRTELELRESEERYRIIADHATDMISRHDPAGNYTYVSPSCRQIFGYEPEEIVGTSAYNYFHAGDVNTVRDIHNMVNDRDVLPAVAYRIRRKNGSYVWVESTSKVVRDGKTGEVKEVIAISRDVSNRKMLEEERNRLFNYSIDMLCVAGLDGYFKQVNPAWTRVLGWTEEELLTTPWIEFVHPDDIENTHVAEEQLAQEETLLSFQNRYRHKHGGYVWLSWNTFVMRGEELLFAVARDITKQKELEENLHYLATTDGLTNIANRRYYLDLTTREMHRAQRHGNNLAIVMFDLDRFKLLNDNYGHQAGDEALRAVSTITRTIIRDHDIFGRIGGEEFSITLTDCDLDNAVAIAERLRQTVQETRVIHQNYLVRITLSCGITTFTASDSLDTLLGRADRALYTAKEEGRNRISVLTPGDDGV